MTLHDVLAAARDRLVAAGIAPDEAALDVELYARTILEWDRGRLLGERRGPVPDGLEPRFSEWLQRREQKEPQQERSDMTGVGAGGGREEDIE